MGAAQAAMKRSRRFSRAIEHEAAPVGALRRSGKNCELWSNGTAISTEIRRRLVCSIVQCSYPFRLKWTTKTASVAGVAVFPCASVFYFASVLILKESGSTLTSYNIPICFYRIHCLFLAAKVTFSRKLGVGILTFLYSRYRLSQLTLAALIRKNNKVRLCKQPCIASGRPEHAGKCYYSQGLVNDWMLIT